MVVILGGSSGMGLATAKAAQAEGARVVITVRSPERLQAARAVLGDEVRTVALDKGFLYSEYCAAYETTYRRNERSDENHLLPSLLRQPSGGTRLPLFQGNNSGGSFGGP